MRNAWYDLRHAARTLVKNATFSSLAVFTLALGIGATTAIFAVLDSVALDPLPYPEPERLVWIDSSVPGLRAGATWGLSQAGYFYFSEQKRTLESLGGYFVTELTMMSPGGALSVDGAAITASTLDVLRVRPALGRLIGPSDDRPGAPPVAVLAHGFWERQYNANPGALGSTVRIDGETFEIIGVMSPGVRLPEQAVDVWVPLQLDPAARPVSSHFLLAVGRLATGISLADAKRDFKRMTSELAAALPDVYTTAFMRDYRFSTRVVPLRDHVIGGMAATLWMLLAAVGLVLIIACANVANIFLARLEGRRREFAVRAALGAGRGRILRQGLAEGAVLGMAAGAVGGCLAYAGLELLRALTPEAIPRLQEIGFDGSTFGFVTTVSLVAGILLGLLPVAHAGFDLSALRDGSRGSTGGQNRHLVRRTLVVAQVALALVLLASTGLMLRSFERLLDVEPGFDPANVLTVQLALPAARYDDFGSVQRFYRQAIERIAALPDVQSAGAASGLPLQGIGICAVLSARAAAPRTGEEAECPYYAYVTPGFFETMGIAVDGQVPDWSAVENQAGGVVITRALAERLWPDGSALGKGLRGNGNDEPYYRVIGVTDDLYNTGLDELPVKAAFFPMLPIEGAPLWAPPRAMTLVLKTGETQPAALSSAVRRIVSDIDPAVPLGGVRSMDAVVADSMARRAFSMLLLAIAAALGLTLSAVGLYGVVSYLTSRRTGEIGIRMALGADGARVAGMVVRQAFLLVAGGIALGLLGALATTRLLRSLLFEISPTDPATLAAVSLVLIAVALLASYLPARRATRINPTEALRHE